MTAPMICLRLPRCRSRIRVSPFSEMLWQICSTPARSARTEPGKILLLTGIYTQITETAYDLPQLLLTEALATSLAEGILSTIRWWIMSAERESTRLPG